MGRGSKKARAEARELAQALGRPKAGRCAENAQYQDARAAERSAYAARSIAATECDYSFGARVERQFLALAHAVAELLRQKEAREAEPEFIAEQAQQEAARGFLAAQLAQTRDSRANGVSRRWRDFGDHIECQLAGLTDVPEPGAWVHCPWETGLFELEGLAMGDECALRIGHAPGDRKLKHRERAREIRFYHPLGDELDPEGDTYFRLIGHVPASLPLPALRATVRALVRKWGEDPADWLQAKIDPDTGRPALDRSGQRVLVPMFDRLARKLKNNTNTTTEKGPASATA